MWSIFLNNLFPCAFCRPFHPSRSVVLASLKLAIWSISKWPMDLFLSFKKSYVCCSEPVKAKEDDISSRGKVWREVKSYSFLYIFFGGSNDIKHISEKITKKAQNKILNSLIDLQIDKVFDRVALDIIIWIFLWRGKDWRGQPCGGRGGCPCSNTGQLLGVF